MEYAQAKEFCEKFIHDVVEGVVDFNKYDEKEVREVRQCISNEIDKNNDGKNLEEKFLYHFLSCNMIADREFSGDPRDLNGQLSFSKAYDDPFIEKEKCKETDKNRYDELEKIINRCEKIFLSLLREKSKFVEKVKQSEEKYIKAKELCEKFIEEVIDGTVDFGNYTKSQAEEARKCIAETIDSVKDEKELIDRNLYLFACCNMTEDKDFSGNAMGLNGQLFFSSAYDKYQGRDDLKEKTVRCEKFITSLVREKNKDLENKKEL